MTVTSSREPQWPPVPTETLPWERDADELRALSRTRRRRVAPTYEAAVPLAIAGRDVGLPRDLAVYVEEVTRALVRYDAERTTRTYDLPALLLRSESASSSQIENLTSSVRNVALAEVCDDVPTNARIVAGNVAAMRRALDVHLDEDLSVETICDVHRALMDPSGTGGGGQLREEQVWVGGDGYSPHGARFVPPRHERVAACLDDLVAYAARDDVSPVVQAAVFHAQLETIHPFVDGNGRCGRTLLHSLLRRSGVLRNTTLPVSAGLLHDVDGYLASLDAYHAGDPVAVVEQVTGALELSVAIGRRMEAELQAVLDGWEASLTGRSDAAVRRLPALLVEHPVVTTALVAERLGVSERAASAALSRACELGMVERSGNRRRGTFYQAGALLDVLERASSAEGIRRLMA